MMPDFVVELILELDNLCDMWEERLGLELDKTACILFKERFERIILFLYEQNHAIEQETNPLKNCEDSVKNNTKQGLEKISFSLVMISLLTEKVEREGENINASNELAWINRLTRASLHEANLLLHASF